MSAAEEGLLERLAASVLRRGLTRFVVGLVILLLGGGTAISVGSKPCPAEAHSLLVRADPPVNAQLREPPPVLTLFFSEPLERKFSRARVVDQNNARADDRIEFDDADDALLRVYLKPLAPGYVTVFWETVSAVDGHRVSGSYPLTILKPDGSVPAGQPATATACTSGAGAKPARVIDKTLLLLAGALLTGALAFIAFVSPAMSGAEAGRARDAIDRRAVAAAAIALAVLLFAGVVELLLQASDIDAGVGTVLDTRWGGRWLLRNLVLVLPAVGLLLTARLDQHHRRLTALLGLPGAVVYLAFVSSVSHSAAGGGSVWAASSDFVHLLAASVWTGMLAMLVLLFLWARNQLDRADKYPLLAAALQRFSAIATASVALLLFTGAVNAVIEVGRLADLVDTGYGRALLIKLVLLLPLLAVGSFNAYVLRPDLVETATAQRGQRNRLAVLADLESQLARTVRWELALAVGVLAVVAVLVQQTPTRGRLAEPAQLPGKFVETQQAGDISATLVIDPNQPGFNTFEVYLTGAVDVVESVRLDFSKQDAGEARLILDPSNPPTFYVGQGPYLAQPGRWKVAVDIRRNRLNDLLLPFTVDLRDPAAATGGGRSGGGLASPFSLTPASAALLLVAAVLSVGLVAGSVRRPGLPSGYVGLAVASISERVLQPRARPALSLAVLLLVGIGLGLFLGSLGHGRLSREEASKDNPVPSSPESIERGRMLFETNCTQCHGESGRGDGPLASTLRIPPANLYDHVPYHPDQFFFNVISNGLSGIMPAFDGLSEEDRWNILNYLRDRFGQPPPTQ